MNANEQTKFIVDNTDGECWHEFPQQGLVGKTDGGHNIYCEKGCMVFIADGTRYKHPSPHDLNALVRLAEKNNFHGRLNICPSAADRNKQFSVQWMDGGHEMQTYCDNLADALRNALVKAIEGRTDNKQEGE